MSGATLLVELRTEELPARGLQALGAKFAGGIHDSLAKLGFLATTSTLRAYATPRRLAAVITDVIANQPEQKSERKGPAIASGLKDGIPTPALAGFAKSCGVTVEQLERAGDGKAEYFVYRITKPGVPLAEQLAGIVEAAIKALPAPKLMRWGASDVQFIRPLQGLVMMHGANVIAGGLLELTSTNRTLGHRFLSTGDIVIPNADAYESTLTGAKVMADFDRRVQTIKTQLAAHAGGATLADASLIDEVAALVEWPAVVEGKFDPAFLAVPQECLMLTMKANQKYFPLLDANGKLLPRFLVVSNMEIPDSHNIVAGNERVLRARLSDAKFFFDQDRKKKLGDLVAPLATVVYHNKLGTQLERTHRIERLATAIASLIGADSSAARRAAHLCKADLMTGMVGEFPELQGLMGMYYARHDGEPQAVAEAIDAHYRPRFAGDALPGNAVGASVALADKLDTLVGIFGIGMVPTGDRDPFGLRRAALGVLRILVEHNRAGQPHAVDLRELLTLAQGGYTNIKLTPIDTQKQVGDISPLLYDGVVEQQDVQLSPNVVDDLIGFMLDRLRSYLRDRSYAPDEIEAVIAQSPTRVDLVIPRLDAVKTFRQLPEAASLAAANKRIGNILKKSDAPDSDTGAKFDAKLLIEPEERALWAGVQTLEPRVTAQMSDAKFADALKSLAGVRSEVDAFFDKVLVNAEDAGVRANRLALLARLNRLMNQVADISKLAN
ncbi:MAG: glycine--tRNA ligase subunit beta [Vicinamibacterales bacterium]